jgi:hypothetical protein
MAARKIELTVTLEPSADAALAAQHLAAAGLEITDIFDAISVIHGRAPASARKKLAKVPGVSDVSPTLVADVGPPDADVS